MELGTSLGVRWLKSAYFFFPTSESLEAKRKLEVEKEKMTYPDACLCVLWVGKPNACYSIRLFVEEHDIGDIPYPGTFFPYVLFDLQNGGRVFLRMLLASRPIELLRALLSQKWGNRTNFKLFEREEVF